MARALSATLRGTAGQPVRRKPCARGQVRCFASGDQSTEGLTLRFHMRYHTKFGQQLCIVGSSEPLGKWEVQRGVPMRWTEGDVWVAELTLPPEGGSELTYKYVVRNAVTLAPVRWQEGNDATLQVPKAGKGSVYRVREAWDASFREVELEAAILAGAADAAAAQAPPAEAAPPSSTAATAAAAPPPQRRGRRRKVDDEAEAIAAIGRAAHRALKQLDEAVTTTMEMLDVSSDPASPELLAADRVVAAAARRATTMTKALDAVGTQKLLPNTEGGSGSGGSGMGSRGSGGRRKRAGKPPPAD